MDNNLPNGWIEVSPLLISEKIRGVSYDKKDVSKTSSKGSLPVLRANNIDENKLNYEDLVYVPESNINESQKLKIGDVVIAMSSGSKSVVGKTAQLNESWAGSFGAFCGVLRPDKNINAKYFGYYFQSKEYRTLISELASGTNINNLKNEHFDEIKFPLPPLPEQQRIVEKLDALMARIRNSNIRLERIPTLLKHFRQSILTAAINGELTKEWRMKNKNVDNAEDLLKLSKQGFELDSKFKEMNEIPESWKWAALGNYAKCSRGRFSIRPRNDPRYFNGKYPFIQIGDLPREGGFVKIHTQTLNEAGFKVSKMFPKNTVAIAIVGATIGNTGILAYDMCFTDSIVGIETGIDYSNFYVDFYLRSEKENFRQISYAGGGQPNIKLETINTYPFPLPPLEEQKEIVRKTEELFHFAESIEARYQKAKAWFDKLPQAILAKAFRGELVPQNERDEAASELLERIQQAKQINHKPSSKSKKRKLYEDNDQLSR